MLLITHCNHLTRCCISVLSLFLPQVLYHNCPGQRTLLITHSNQALNDLFQKMVARDIPARYLLRLGMGERDLDVDDDFSRAGRVNNMLARRLTLLAEVRMT
jgi:intron-binding protein aquarius